MRLRSKPSLTFDDVVLVPRCSRVASRAEGYVVDKPATMDPGMTVRQARQVLSEAGIGGLVVVDAEGRLLGLLTRRDVLFAPDSEAPMREVMTPREPLVTASSAIDLEQARRQFLAHRVENLRPVDSSDRRRGLVTARDIIKIERHPQACKDAKGRLWVGAAIGARSAEVNRAAGVRPARRRAT
jgi:IMP dehydrogenase